MRLSNLEARTVKMAMEILAKKPKYDDGQESSLLSGAPSILRQIGDINHKNSELTGYLRNQVINAITKPLAYMFFLSHNAMEEGVVEKLADYLDSHAGKDLSIWYEGNNE